MCLVRCKGRKGSQEFPIFVHHSHLLPRPASVMDLTTEEKKGRAFLRLHGALAFCQPMKLPVVTGDKKWIHVTWKDQGSFARCMKAESGAWGWSGMRRGWDVAVGGTGTSLEREGWRKDWSKESLGKKVEMEKGDGV